MRSEKQLLLDEIEGSLEQSNGFLLVDYAGLTANQSAELRFQLRKYAADMETVRKKVLAKALNKRGLTLDTSSLNGHVAVIFVFEEAVETVKFVLEYAKTTARPAVLAGHFEGQWLDAPRVQQFALLPTKSQMRAQLLATLVAPMSQTLATVNALLTSVLHCLENKQKKEDGAA